MTVNASPENPFTAAANSLKNGCAVKCAESALRFGKLQREVPGVSQKTLTRNLRELEASGILTRTVYAEVPPRVEYQLTNSGTDLMPVFMALHQWHDQHPD